jgi:hypothetical protein
MFPVLMEENAKLYLLLNDLLLLNNLFLSPVLLNGRRRALTKSTYVSYLFDMGLEGPIGKDPSKSETCVMSRRIRPGVL